MPGGTSLDVFPDLQYTHAKGEFGEYTVVLVRGIRMCGIIPSEKCKAHVKIIVVRGVHYI